MPKMLLRSASTPILRSWVPQPHENDAVPPHLPRPSSLSFSFSPTTITARSRAQAHFPLPRLQRQGGGGSGGEGRRIFPGGGRSDGQDGPGSQGQLITEAYYQGMIEANPGSSLLLANYARFLREVKGEARKAGEYCERAILANPGDGNVLSLYADIVWQAHGDARRAESYFHQAVQSSPHDCYVLASYAKFLWDAEDDDEENELPSPVSSQYWGGAPHHSSPITAASS